MPTTRLKDKLSSIVASQLPEHIRSDYPIFVSFIEAYYEYLEQDQYAQELIQNALLYNDIDRTSNDFIRYFQKQYLDQIPKTALADKTLLVKKIRDLYDSKGSSKSYELFFKLIYNVIPELEYPGDYILRSSNGEWTQRSSVYIKKVFGNESSILDRTVNVSNSTKQTALRLGSTIFSVKILQGGAEVTSTDTFEYEFDNTTNVNLEIGDTVTTSTFQGTIVGIPGAVRIVQKGSGFSAGGLYEINYPGATGAKIKINSVNSAGGITSAQLLTFGINYPDDFNFYLTPQTAATGIKSFTTITSGNSAFSANIFEEHGRISDFGNVIITTSAGSSSIISFSFGSEVSIAPTSTVAVINLKNQAKAFYPGYFKSTTGFLSDSYVLQDRDYYQPYSYVVRSTVQLKEYKTALLGILHPVGAKLHSTYVLQNEFLFGPGLTTGFGLALNDFTERLFVNDQFSFTGSFSINLPNIGTSVTDTPVITSSYVSSFEHGNVVTDTIVITSASQTTFEHGNVVTDTAVIVQDYGITFEHGNVVTDTADIIEDYGRTFEHGNVVTDTAVIVQDYVRSFEHGSALSDSGNIFIEDYASDTTEYFSEDYVRTTFTF